MPGAGQLLAGQRRCGAALLAVAALVAAAAVTGAARLLLAEGPGGLLARLLQPGMLAGLLAANATVALMRGLVAVDAWRLARDRRGRAGAAHIAGLFAVLALVVALPHAGVAVAGVQAQQVIAAVFVAPTPTTAPAPTPTTAPAPTPTPDPDPGVPITPGRVAPGVRGTPTPDDATPAPTPEFATDELFDGATRLSVLLLGSDAGPGRSGTRIDAMVVASVDVVSGETALISIARNLGDVPLSGVFAERLGARFPDRLMGLHPAAAGDPVLAAEFDDAGAAAHVNAAETLLGLRIDHVAKVDLAGFVDVIDALGGVEVDVAEPIRVRLSPPSDGEDWRSYDIPAGRQHLDGHEAHAYVRSRTGTDDYDRMRRQRCLIGAAAARADAMRLLRVLPGLAEVFTERVRTDIPADRLPDLARLAGRVDVSALRTLGLTPPTYTDGASARGFHRADVPRVQAAVRDLMTGDGPGPRGAGDLDTTCG